MALRKEISFEKSIPYHVLSRTVERREIFVDPEDCWRFIFQMYAANVGKPALNLHRKDYIKAGQALLNGEEIPEKFVIVEHSPLVYFLSFVLVINHPHFILVPAREFGIPKYMQKLKTGFSMYFNLKHGRKGNLFDRPYKIVPIQANFQLDAVLRYVNVKNVLDVSQPGWREKGLTDLEKAFNSLESYSFSSFPDLFGKRKSKIIAPLPILEKYLGKEISVGKNEFLKFIKDYLQKNLIDFNPLFLEE